MLADVPPVARVPLLVLGMLSLLFGVLGGLARLAVAVPPAASAQAGAHAALMIAAFFATVISLERAVALGRSWAYLAPLAAGGGGLVLLLGGPLAPAQSLFVASSAMLLVASVRIVQRQAALFTVMLAIAAACLMVGNLAWMASGSIHTAVPMWLSFIVLTIAGERLELTRFLPRRSMAAPAFVIVSASIVLGAAVSLWHESAGLRVFAAGLFALAAWLLVFDIARHNARQTGLTRFIAICLLTGYVWLALGAALGLGGALTPGHGLRDASVHAVALGFVFAMVFGHAPIIFPAVLRVRIPYHPIFYVPLVVLHASLALRFGGTLADSFVLRQQGASVNALALVLFIATMIVSAFRGKSGAPTKHRRS
ncbi:MAG TPA: hypothetical protein PK725_08080 [Rhodocyclaceae bacterium]|nr:hypothetical protein [Rhodocyclaceae bacterium]HRQ46895.1 hypothetical protein [Rhodocyclaceae bacterium]